MTMHLSQFASTLGAFAAAAVVALGVRTLALRALRRWGTTSGSTMDEVVLGSLRWPSIMWSILLAAYIAIDITDLPARPSATIQKILFSLLVISVTAAAANLSGAALRQGLRQTSLAIPATGITLTFLKVTIWVVGALILLSGLGISVTPVLTALGVGGLAVALALQDTLSNFFAGLHLLIERPVRVGDFVKLETGQEGYVEDIGWRTTRIRMLPNDMVILPNSRLTQSILTNYYLPSPQRGISIAVSVGYETDPDHLEHVLIDEAQKAVGTVQGLLAEPAPNVRFIPGFGSSSLDFSLNVHVAEFTDQYLVQHELRKRILSRLRAERITMPYPHQQIVLETPPPALPRSS
ncbi:MAG TPA: mechanosensitive ion channel family protein [Nitrospirales bacterium]|nr:mechanosensitive ion channel family protein [Nitrospirales bacterium]